MWQLWAMPGYRTPESWQHLYVPAKVKANQQRMVSTFPICNTSLGMQFQVRLPCGDFKLAGLCLSDCTALAAGRYRQHLAGFWQPLCTPCWHSDLPRTQTIISCMVQIQLWKHRVVLTVFTMPAHPEASSGRTTIWKAKWNKETCKESSPIFFFPPS